MAVKKCIRNTHRMKSTAKIRAMSSVGKPTAVSTITKVTSPACGMPAAPILANVAVMLRLNNEKTISMHI